MMEMTTMSDDFHLASPFNTLSISRLLFVSTRPPPPPGGRPPPQEWFLSLPA